MHLACSLTMLTTQFHRSLAPGLAGSAVGLCAFVVTALPLREASACSPPPPGVFLSAAEQTSEGIVSLPLDGVLLVQTECYASCPDDPEALGLVVTDSSGDPIAGDVASYTPDESPSVSLFAWEGSRGWVAWKAEGDLVEGESYSVHAEGEMVEDDLLDGIEYLAGPAASANVPQNSPVLEEQVADIQLVRETACCEEAEILDSCTYDQCETVALRANRQIKLRLGLTLNEDESDQFVFNAQATSDDTAELPPKWTRSTDWSLSFPPADQYCYVVRALHLSTGTETVIADACEADEGLPFGDLDAAVRENNTGLFDRCTVPPDGREALWCATFAENVSSGSCEGAMWMAACEAAVAACPPPPTGGGTGGSPSLPPGVGGYPADNGTGGFGSLPPGVGGYPADNGTGGFGSLPPGVGGYPADTGAGGSCYLEDLPDGVGGYPGGWYCRSGVGGSTLADSDPSGNESGAGAEAPSEDVRGCTIAAPGGTPGGAQGFGGWATLLLFVGLGFTSRRRSSRTSA